MRAMATPSYALPLPTEDEKNLAMMSYILSIFTGWVGPLIIWLVKRESKFIVFHAVQILLWHVIYIALIFVGAIIFVAGIFGTIAASSTSHNGQPPAAFIVLMPLMFLIFWGGWFVNLILGIVYAIKAKNGEWSQIILVGGWARRAAGLPQ